MKKTLRAAVIAVALSLTSCGGGASEEDVSEAVKEALAKQAASAKAEAATTVESAAAAPVTSPAAAAAAQAAAPPAQPLAGAIAIPDVVGLDHQLAQDTMQSAGLYNLTEEDATGAGRMLLVDRNWVVVEQIPAAGSKVASDATITLRSKRNTD